MMMVWENIYSGDAMFELYEGDLIMNTLLLPLAGRRDFNSRSSVQYK